MTIPPRPAALAMFAGGVAVAAGAILPWLTLYAGLHSYSGLTGWNGRLLLLGGLVTMFLALLLLHKPRIRLLQAAGALGFLLLAGTAWVSWQSRMLLASLGENPLIVAERGAGLTWALAGAAAIVISWVLVRGWGRQPEPGWPTD